MMVVEMHTWSPDWKRVIFVNVIINITEGFTNNVQSFPLDPLQERSKPYSQTFFFCEIAFWGWR
jgi:hypothetical protein